MSTTKGPDSAQNVNSSQNPQFGSHNPCPRAGTYPDEPVTSQCDQDQEEKEQEQGELEQEEQEQEELEQEEIGEEEYETEEYESEYFESECLEQEQREREHRERKKHEWDELEQVFGQVRENRKNVKDLQARSDVLEDKWITLELEITRLSSEFEKLRGNVIATPVPDATPAIVPEPTPEGRKHTIGAVAEPYDDQALTIRPKNVSPIQTQHRHTSTTMPTEHGGRIGPQHGTIESISKLKRDYEGFQAFILQANASVKTLQAERAQQDAKIRQLQERNVSYSRILKREMRQRDFLRAAFGKIHREGITRYEDVDTLADKLEDKDNPLMLEYEEKLPLKGIIGLPNGPQATANDHMAKLSMQRSLSSLLEQRGQGMGPANSVLKNGGHSENTISQRVSSAATGPDMLHIKRKRDGSDAADVTNAAHQKRRLDLDEPNPVSPQGRRVRFDLPADAERPTVERDLSNRRARPVGTSGGVIDALAPVGPSSAPEAAGDVSASNYSEREQSLTRRAQSLARWTNSMLPKDP